MRCQVERVAPAGHNSQHCRARARVADVEYGHDRGVRMGWYHSICQCPEQHLSPSDVEAIYRGDTAELLRYGFDSIKLDGCGDHFLDMNKWATLLNRSSKPILIENCHWGYCTGMNGRFKRPEDSSCPRQQPDGSFWCPFNFFRTSKDIDASDQSWIRNLQTVVKFLDASSPLAGRGCWAYPDMIETGNLRPPALTWERAHFGAWCIVSSPLVLGLNLLDEEAVDRVWDIISNREAIAVNQRWAGHPGRLVHSWTPDGGRRTRPDRKCAVPCGVEFVDVLDAMQLWAKPQPGNSLAVLVINIDAASAGGLEYELKLSELHDSLPTEMAVRDIWSQRDVGETVGGVFRGSVAPRDSAFLLLSPPQPPQQPPVPPVPSTPPAPPPTPPLSPPQTPPSPPRTPPPPSPPSCPTPRAPPALPPGVPVGDISIVVAAVAAAVGDTSIVVRGSIAAAVLIGVVALRCWCRAMPRVQRREPLRRFKKATAVRSREERPPRAFAKVLSIPEPEAVELIGTADTGYRRERGSKRGGAPRAKSARHSARATKSRTGAEPVMAQDWLVADSAD